MIQPSNFLEMGASESFNPKKNWQKLIDHQIIPQDAEYNENEDFSLQVLKILDYATYNNREFNDFYYKFFNHFFPYTVQWIYDKDEIDKISSKSILYINQEDPKIEWLYIDHFYFKLNEQYYYFFIYNFIGRAWINRKSFLAIFNQVLKYFNLKKLSTNLYTMRIFFAIEMLIS